MLKVAILDDYANAALQSADWARLAGVADITVFDRHLSEEEAASALESFDILCTMRERMAMPRSLFEKLPRLKAVAIVGLSLPNLDIAAATEHGVVIIQSDFRTVESNDYASSTPELAWGLMIATMRHIAEEERRMREGGWQRTVGVILSGKTLGLLGLGRIGKRMAGYASAFGMNVIAWSQNLTAEAASAVGVRYVEKKALFAEADVVSIHVQLSARTRGLVTANDLALMKPGAYLINTSRAAIVDTAALVEALRERRLAGAGIDVFDVEPPPADHPFRTMDNVTLTPHLGYVTRETLRVFYGAMPEAIAALAKGAPIHVANPDALKHAKHRA